MNENELRAELKAWIKQHANLPPDAVLDDDTPILQAGLLSSLHVAQLFLWIESRRGEEVDMSVVDPEVLTSVDTLYAAFFAPALAAAATDAAARGDAPRPS